MATVLELAAYAELPAETVLRVLLREPTNEAACRRVAEAVEALGLPDYPRPNGHVEVLPATDEPLSAPALPARIEPPAVPGAHELATEIRSLLQLLGDRLERDRRERIDDLALTIDLTTDGWRNVDRRLGRLEKIVERLSREEYFEGRRPTAGAEVHRLDDVRRHGA